MNKSIAIIALLLAVTVSAHGQVYNWADGEAPLKLDSVQGFVIGLNIGFYQANNKTASMYGGYGFDREGVRLTFPQSWLNQAIQGNPIFRSRTSEALGLADGEWQFTESDMPGAMRFSPSFMWGAHARYHFTPDFGMFVEVNGTRPVTVGEFTITTFNATNQPQQQQQFRRFGIRGEEQRLIFTLGAHQVLGRKARERRGDGTMLLPFIDFGVNSTFTRFEENYINLGPLVGNIDITQIFQQQGFQVDQARVLTGVGVGAFGGAGAQLHLGQNIMLDLAYIASLEQVKLGEINQRAFQHIIVLRAIWVRF
jgi:hypothetical protein